MVYTRTLARSHMALFEDLVLLVKLVVCHLFGGHFAPCHVAAERYLTLAERRGFAYEKILCFYSNADFVGVPIF